MVRPSQSSRLVLVAIVIAVATVALVRGGSSTSSTATPGDSQASLEQGPGSETTPERSTESAALGTIAPTSPPSGPPQLSPIVGPTEAPVACTPTDQDKYVYHPYRLDAQAACIRVTGVVKAVRTEADGDLHILLALDPAFRHLLTPANQGVELGDLVIEPVCVRNVTQTDAIDICNADPDPLAPPFPVTGERVWMAGRYVFDLDHGGWAELHPLYRWGSN